MCDNDSTNDNSNTEVVENDEQQLALCARPPPPKMSDTGTAFTDTDTITKIITTATITATAVQVREEEAEENGLLLLQQQETTPVEEIDEGKEDMMIDVRLINTLSIEDLRELVKQILVEITTNKGDEDEDNDTTKKNNDRIRVVMSRCIQQQQQQQRQQDQEQLQQRVHEQKQRQKQTQTLDPNNSVSSSSTNTTRNNNATMKEASRPSDETAASLSGISASSSSTASSSFRAAARVTSRAPDPPTRSPAALPPPPDPPTPLLRTSRASHEMDDSGHAKCDQPPPLPNVRRGRGRGRQQQEPPSPLPGGKGTKQQHQQHKQQQQLQLVVLCHRKPKTIKEGTDQDLAMTLCKRMGIIPHVVVSSESSSTPAREEELLLFDAIMMNSGNGNGNDNGATTDSGNDNDPISRVSFSYPQFFIRTVDDNNNNSNKNNNNNSSSISIEYKGDYDLMEKLYRMGAFTADSLVVSSSSPTNNTDDDDDDSGPRRRFHSNKKDRSRSRSRSRSSSAGTSLSSSERENDSYSHLEGLNQPSPKIKKDSSSRSKDSTGSSAGTLSIGEDSYSHLDGLNQPNSNNCNRSSNKSFGEISLGDDLRMIFDDHMVEDDDDNVGTANGHTVEDDHHCDHNVDHNHNNERRRRNSTTPSFIGSTPMTVTVPTITEDDEDDDDDDDYDYEDENDDDHDHDHDAADEQQEKDSEQKVGMTTVARTISPTGRHIMTESLTLRPSSPLQEEEQQEQEQQLRRPQQEPPGTTAAEALCYAKNSLKPSPPTSASPRSPVASTSTSTSLKMLQQQQQQYNQPLPQLSTSSALPRQEEQPQQPQQQHKKKKKKKSTNPYYALEKYNGGARRDSSGSGNSGSGSTDSRHSEIQNQSKKGQTNSTTTNNVDRNRDRGVLQQVQQPHGQEEEGTQQGSPMADISSVAVISTPQPQSLAISDTPNFPPTITTRTVLDTNLDQQNDKKEMKKPRRNRSSWEQNFEGIGACYLVFSGDDDDNDDDDNLTIHYSERPIKNAVGVWTSSTIVAFKEAQGFSTCELIGTCASHVTRGGNPKNYYQGWCQFIKAAKNMDATVTVLKCRVGVGSMGGRSSCLPDVDFYLYQQNGTTVKISLDDDNNDETSNSFDTAPIDAVACVPQGAHFPATGLVGKKWSKAARKLGAVALFTKMVSANKMVEVEAATATTTTTTRSTTTVVGSEQQSPSAASTTSPEISAQREKNCSQISYDEERNEQDPKAIPIPIPKSVPLPVSVPSKKRPSVPVVISPPPEPEPEPPSLSMQLPTPEGGACYLVYDPDSSGQIVEHYVSTTPVDFAIGRWSPGAGKKIAGFKFKRNVGRNVLIGNCSAGVQGRKNYSSGWCQFVRSAYVMGGEIILWDPAPGHKGLMVDVYLYYGDPRPTHQTFKMEQSMPYTTDKLQAVACIPKDTPFFAGITVDLLRWLADGSKYGYSSKM